MGEGPGISKNKINLKSRNVEERDLARRMA